MNPVWNACVIPAAPASLLTIFGATGDLAQRMLLPSLYGLQREGLLPSGLRILCTARSELDREAFAGQVGNAIGECVPASERSDEATRGLLERLDYAPRASTTTPRWPRWPDASMRCATATCSTT